MVDASAPAYRKLAILVCLLAYGVVMLGAFVRLSDAGLGCPDWPGCYGHITVPSSAQALEQAQATHPQRPVEAAKAWKEMVHRYFAGTLGLLILVLAIWATRIWLRAKDTPLILPWLLVAVVCFQAVLGMWTVTWQLKPLVVSAHLLGGMATLALLFWLALKAGRRPRYSARRPRLLRGLASVALVLLVVQLFLGVWTSSNYAALACSDFPYCQHGQWLPSQLDYGHAYVLWHGLGINYEYGILDSPARATIHFTHRVGALVVSTVLLLLCAGMILGERSRTLRWLGGLVLLATCLQVGLGISIVELMLPLPVGVAHNGGAALLLLSLVAASDAIWRTETATT